MGTVHLTSGHQRLFIRSSDTYISNRIVLNPAWLDEAIISIHGEALNEKHQRITKAMFRALLALPFDSAVSYYVKVMGDTTVLQMPWRVWGEITLGGPSHVIVGFSHDSRYDNAPYRYVQQWVEDLWNPKGSPDDSQSWEEWSDPERWGIFFRLRIKQAADEAREKASQLQIEAGALQRRANKISSLLTKSKVT